MRVDKLTGPTRPTRPTRPRATLDSTRLTTELTARRQRTGTTAGEDTSPAAHTPTAQAGRR
eukprot:7036071-Prymnesium_polylepis.1